MKLMLVMLLMCCPVLAVADDSLDIIREAAEQGDAKAQYKLGCMYDNGDGVPQDYKEAAEHGDACAQLNLGIMYCEGKGVPQDKIRAYELLLKSGRQGLRMAQDGLVRLCKESPWACK